MFFNPLESLFLVLPRGTCRVGWAKFKDFPMKIRNLFLYQQQKSKNFPTTYYNFRESDDFEIWGHDPLPPPTTMPLVLPLPFPCSIVDPKPMRVSTFKITLQCIFSCFAHSAITIFSPLFPFFTLEISLHILQRVNIASHNP